MSFQLSTLIEIHPRLSSLLLEQNDNVESYGYGSHFSSKFESHVKLKIINIFQYESNID